MGHRGTFQRNAEFLLNTQLMFSKKEKGTKPRSSSMLMR